MSTKNHIITILYVAVLFLPIACKAQWDSVIWEKKYGWALHDNVLALAEDEQGNVLLTGETRINLLKGKDVFFRKIDAKGKVLVQEYYGEDGDDIALSVATCPDGGVVLAGFGRRVNKDTLGGADAWLLKVGEAGQPLFSRIFGGKKNDSFTKVLAFPDGKILAAGYKGDSLLMVCINVWGETLWQRVVESQGLEVIGLHNDVHSDQFTLILKAEKPGGFELQQWNAHASSGQIIQLKRFPLPANIVPVDAKPFFNQGLIWLGHTQTFAGREDIVVGRIDAAATPVWNRTFGGIDQEFPRSLAIAQDSLILVVGEGLSHFRGARRTQGFLLQLNPRGRVLPTVTKDSLRYFGGKGDESLQTVLICKNGDLLAAGSTNSTGLSPDAWCFRLRPLSKKQYQDYDWYKSLSTSAVHFYEALPNDTLFANERAWYSFKVMNRGVASIQNLKLRLYTSPVNDLFLPQYLELGYLPLRDSQIVSFPLRGGFDLESGRHVIKLAIFNSLDSLIHTFEISLTTKARPRPKLEMHNERFILKRSGSARREDFQIAFSIINRGDAVAQYPKVRIMLPYLVDSSENLLRTLPNLKPNDSVQLSFTFKIKAHYPWSYLKMGCYFWEDSENLLKYKSFGMPVIPFDSIEADVPIKVLSRGNKGGPFEHIVEDRPKIEQASIEWIAPDSLSKDIVYQEDTLAIKLKINLPENEIFKEENLKLYNGRNPVPENWFAPNSTSLVQLGTSNTFIYTTRIILAQSKYDFILKLKQPNEQFVASDILKVEYQPKKYNLHLLSVGVPQPDLPLADNDAEDVHGLFTTENDAFVFDTANLKLCNKNHNTTFEYLAVKLTKLCKPYDSLDVLVIYIASHGYLDPIDPNNLMIKTSSSEPWSFKNQINWAIQNLACIKLVLLDLCHSQSAIYNLESTKTPSILNRYNIISSCKIDQLALASDKWENSVFIKSIKESFENSRKQHTKLTLRGLVNHIVEEVPKLTKDFDHKPLIQEPVYAGKNGNLVIFRPKLEKRK